LDELAAEILSQIEHRELKLLTWGYVDGGFSHDELIELIEGALEDRDRKDVMAEDLLRILRDRELVVEVPAGHMPNLRSRMAETIRLLARLRQLFPRHRGGSWADASTLVSDFRILARSRQFPSRRVSKETALETVEAAGIGATGQAAARAVLGARGQDFRLAQFQVDAAQMILSGIAAASEGGTIVGAGTGSGKTLAFYLPTLAFLADQQAAQPATRVLALYPRIELLRDQLRQLLQESRALRGLDGMKRGLTIGVLYGRTPNDPQAAKSSRYQRWQESSGGLVCPFTPCPYCDDEAQLIWRTENREAGRELVVCESCSESADELVLTRKSLRKSPPDILFTTTEMLNRALGDGWSRDLIGASRSGRIELLLLDEVHTYGEVHGAHVASLLRRWRAAQPRRPHFVGLSATLADAAQFFGSIVGLDSYKITHVAPRASDLEAEGQEYMLALRSDPHSRAGVLSTSIQTAMLLARVMDRPGDSVSEGAFGEKVFAFTDDLDVTNRLYFDLLDAEGRGARNFFKADRTPLASLRSPNGQDLAGRRAAGQVWDLPQSLGWPLTDEERGRLRVGRTSSQDPNVAGDSNVIVATASLEVGFDDDSVGVALQHKSPHTEAAFLQRKGRAGRTRQMRPWTAIVLSDYGRDRTTYQSYERLFDPELRPRPIPTGNPVVLRMQAVFALMDWLTSRLGTVGVRIRLEQPAGDNAARKTNQAKIASTLRQVLTHVATRDDLAHHLQVALGLDAEAVDEILWDPPRPLLTAVIPTVLRRLETDWGTAAGGPGSEPTGSGPLPEFVISSLFADLELPEVVVATEKDEQPMRAVQALTAFAPGRASHRLTVRRARDRFWLPPPDFEKTEEAQLDIADRYSGLTALGMSRSAASADPVRCVRPTRLRLSEVPPEIRSSSNAQMEWRSELIPPQDGVEQIDLGETPGSELVPSIAVFSHGRRAPVDVRRWAESARIELVRDDGGEFRGRANFVSSGEAIGVGLAIHVDALGLDLGVPGTDPADDLPGDLLRSLRVERFQQLVDHAPHLELKTSTFARRAASDAYLALLAGAASSAGSAVAAHDQLVARGLVGEIQRARSGLTDPDEVGEPEPRDDLIAAVIADYASVLWNEPDQDWDRWLGESLKATVGAAVHAAISHLCPEFDFDEVNLDLGLRSNDHGDDRIWLTESTPGGGGALQEAARRIAERPWVFGGLVVDALGPSDSEMVASELDKVLALSQASETPIPAGLAAVRSAATNHERVVALGQLRRDLAGQGVFTTHAVMSAVSTRLLRPGAKPNLDGFSLDLIARWRELEDLLNLEVPLRAFAWLASGSQEFDDVAGVTPPSGVAPGRWRAGQITGLLWPRGLEARSAGGLQARNRFHDLPRPDRLLAQVRLTARVASVNWRDYEHAKQAGGPLGTDGSVDLVASTDEVAELRQTLLGAAAERIETGAVLLAPALAGIRRSADQLSARLMIEDLV